MIGVFLQARMDSSRLPGKALLPLAGKPVLMHAMEALLRVQADVHALLTEEGSKAAFAQLAENLGYEIYVGSKHDVLKRFTDAARFFGVSRIIRATGDNPLVSWELATELLKECVSLDADYGGHVGMPVGLGVECLKTEALFRAERETNDAYDREHVAPYLYKNPRLFHLHRPLAPLSCRSGFSVTIDTREDFDRVGRIFKDLYRGIPINTADLMEWIYSHDGEYAL